ncbi:hypothetical protein F511_25938 [Dorcoceras hygrometricum]|uniref:Dof zinc finger protein n=1 Tax=Dorcoceras hygrometricum TaxID=472368 RepID=A0A2Z7BCL8_9LAMI|nr:hypothetical protein F511_25938 [Dorcoceras hygrometricum]
MQDPYLYSQIKAQAAQFPEQEQLKCPRCDSPNTKFCYYNNYNLSQPRHFCKSCKRYWTKGGALRNIPVGGSSRKNAKRSSADAVNSQQSKRPASSSSPSNASINNSSSNSSAAASELLPVKGGDSYGGQFGNFIDVSSSFGSLLGSSGGQYGPDQVGMGSANSNNGDDGFLNIEEAGESGCWSGGSGLPELAIYTPSSNFHL